MRLSEFQQNAIHSAVATAFGDGAKVWLFGSRVDDNQRGGDIDLLIETDQIDLAVIARAELHFLSELQQKIGEQKIDLLIDYPARHTRPLIFTVAKQTGIQL